MAIEQKAKELHIFQREIDIVIQKVINFSIIGNNKQKSELGNIINTPQSYPINKAIINFRKFVGETYNSYSEESKKIQTITDDIKARSINNSSKKDKHNIFDSKTNNEIKALKNHKIVYINKYLLNSYSISRSLKKFKKITVKFAVNK